MTDTATAQAAKLLGRARRVVVFTGAGMSAESGVPTFRDTLTGLWQRYDPQELATPAAFEADPALVWGWYEWRRAAVARARPHPGHLAVAAIETHAPHTVLVTQNVDDLHERAGSTDPLHLHGSLFAPAAPPAPTRHRPPPRTSRPRDGGCPRRAATAARRRSGRAWCGSVRRCRSRPWKPPPRPPPPARYC